MMARADRRRARHAPSRSSASCPASSPGKHIWCQLFSEPGSRLGPRQHPDRGRARRRRVDRQRPEGVDVGRAVLAAAGSSSPAPTPTCPKHEGITYFVIDMDQPGVEVRPLKEMTGGATFNEVFFTDARVPRRQPHRRRRPRVVGRGDHAVARAQEPRRRRHGRAWPAAARCSASASAARAGRPRPDLTASGSATSVGAAGGGDGRHGGDGRRHVPLHARDVRQAAATRSSARTSPGSTR